MRHLAPIAIALTACATGALDDPPADRWSRTLELPARLPAPAPADDACGPAPSGEAAASPLSRHVIGGARLDRGFVVYLHPDAARPRPEALLHAIRCHRTWAAGGGGGADGPLALAGLRVVAQGDATGISVELTARDPALVPELQRRAAKELERAASRHRPEEYDR
jgi:hypothetical protein